MLENHKILLMQLTKKLKIKFKLFDLAIVKAKELLGKKFREVYNIK